MEMNLEEQHEDVNGHVGAARHQPHNHGGPGLVQVAAPTHGHHAWIQQAVKGTVALV
jgi:hypothetical protein